MTAENTAPVPGLADVRREIDEIDERLLALLDARFAAVARVRAAKEAVAGPGRAAFRPGREAEVLRRLAARRGSNVPLELMVRLWRSIMGAATQMQDGLRVFASQALLADARASGLLGTQFSRLSACKDAGEAIRAAAAGGLAAVWLHEGFAELLGGLHVIGALGEPLPEVFLVGAPALAEPSGDDETLLAAAAAPHGALWWSHGLAGMAGFLHEQAVPAGSRLLGRYPRLNFNS